MSHNDIGPKLRQLRELAARKFSKKPSVADLRGKVAKVKPMTKHGGKRGR